MSKAVNFTEATYLALHAMALIAEKNGISLSIHAMAARLSVSEAHLAKVIQRLARSGLIITTRGPNGGAVLAKKPEDTTYLDIFEAIEGKLEAGGCVFGARGCALPQCVFRGFLATITAETETWLRNNTLADFAVAGKEPGGQ